MTAGGSRPAGTLGAEVAAARERLAAAGIASDEDGLDAVLLARHVLGWDAATWIARETDPAPPGFVERYRELVARRTRREPMGYLLGRVEFWGLELEVSPAVLIPRPESEIIVEAALGAARGLPAPLIVDVGTGSGCLAVALASALPAARILAIDVSAPALAVARRNAARHGVARRIALVRGDLLGPLRGEADLIVSNPPYVPRTERHNLQPEVRAYEPPEALFAGDDGLAVIRRLVAGAETHLRPGGWLIFELGIGQQPAVRALLEQSGRWHSIDIRPDLQGIPRTAMARRRMA
jgi:release factor glutamine methyltransferase